MKLLIHVQLHTTEYRGDHSAEVQQVVNCPSGTTVDELCKALVDANLKNDYLEIRAMEIKE